MDAPWNVTNVLSSGAAMDFCSHLLTPQSPLSTGFEQWDKGCHSTGGRGLADWWYVIVGGAANSGKTQLMRHLARRAIEGPGEHLPGLISMEVPTTGIQRQVYADIGPFGYHQLNPADFQRLATSIDPIDQIVEGVSAYRAQHRDGGLLVAEHEGRPTLSEVEVVARRMVDGGVTVLFLDHLQLIKPDHRGMSVAEAAEETSERLRVLAHKSEVLVVALSQLNRSASRERDRQPTMFDLWGGTSMESNANQVVLLDHSRTKRDVADTAILRTHILLDKNREGPARVSIPVEINFRKGAWREALPDELNLWPGVRR